MACAFGDVVTRSKRPTIKRSVNVCSSRNVSRVNRITRALWCHVSSSYLLVYLQSLFLAPKRGNLGQAIRRARIVPPYSVLRINYIVRVLMVFRSCWCSTLTRPLPVIVRHNFFHCSYSWTAPTVASISLCLFLHFI